MHVFDLNKKLEDGRKIEDLISDICSDLDVEFTAYSGSKPGETSPRVFTNYPNEWVKYYLENQLHLVDPALLIVSRSKTVLHWDCVSNEPETQSIFLMARDFGLPDLGVTIPVTGKNGDLGLFSICCTLPRSMWQNYIDQMMPQIQEKAAFIHDMMMRQSTDGVPVTPHDTKELSSFEKSILQRLANGVQIQDLGDVLKQPDGMIRLHLNSACRKLSAVTVPQAITRALLNGDIKA